MPDEKPTGMEIIAAERKRQVEIEHWTPEHDDTHDKGELGRAANCYYKCGNNPGHVIFVLTGKSDWPWDWRWFKPFDKSHRGYFPKVDRLRCLVKAGALAMAEEERLERLPLHHKTPHDYSDMHALVMLAAQEIDRLQKEPSHV